MSRSIVIIASIAVFLSAGPVPVSWGDAAADLRKKIENVQESYDSALKEYNDALRAMSRHEGDLEAAESAVERRRGEMEAALEELKEVQEFARDRSDISDAKEKEAYAAAKAAHEKARMALGEKTEQLHEAKSSATSALTALKGYRGELGNLNRQVSAVRFRKLQDSLSRESTVTARGEFGCEEVTVRQCRDGALELAKRSAVEQASAVILESSTVLEEFRTFIGSEAVAEDRQMMKERIESHVTGILVSHRIIDKGWIGETGYFYEIEAVVKGQVSEAFFRIAGSDDLPVPPEPEEAMTLARADVESEQAHDVAIGYDPATEVLRLRDRIRDTRDRIETLREAGLKDAQEVYEGSLAAIGPKDMFETEAEYHARDAREKGDAAIARAKARSEVNRKYGGLLSEEVEPLLERVNELLGSADVIHGGAILTKLEKYDPEQGIFVGALEIDSTLIQMKAEMIIPMNRESARDFWENRDSLVGRMLLTIDSHSLEIGIDEFWLEDPESGSRTKERISIIEVRRPSSEEELKLAQGLSASAAELGKRVAERETWPSMPYRAGGTEAQGWVSEYNRLIDEVKTVFPKDVHIRALKSLEYSDINNAQVAVATSAWSLEAYLISFRSDEAFAAVAKGLAKRVAERETWPSMPYRAGGTEAQGWVSEYNRLIGEVKSVFPKDVHIQALKSLEYSDINNAQGAVATGARSLEAYLISFRSDQAFAAAAKGLGERVAERDTSPYSSFSAGETEAQGWVSEYNRLIDEVKTVFPENTHIQALKRLQFHDVRSTQNAVVTAANRLVKAMENIE